MPKAAFPSFGIIQRCNGFPFHLLISRDNHLCNSFSILQFLYLCGKINNGNFYLSPIIFINSARRINHCNSLFYGYAASWADLCLKSFRQRHVQPGGNELSFHWLKQNGLWQPCSQIHARGPSRLVLRQHMWRFIDNTHFYLHAAQR